MFLHKSLLVVRRLCVSLGYAKHNGEVSNLLKCYWSVDIVFDAIYPSRFSGFLCFCSFKISIFNCILWIGALEILCVLVVFVTLHCFIFAEVHLCGICRLWLQTVCRWVMLCFSAEKMQQVDKKQEGKKIFEVVLKQHVKWTELFQIPTKTSDKMQFYLIFIFEWHEKWHFKK